MKILVYLGILTMVATLSFPLSAGAFGRSPSSSEVFNAQTSKRTAATSNTENKETSGTNGSPQVVPEPSSFLLFAIAIGVMVMVARKKQFRQTIEKE